MRSTNKTINILENVIITALMVVFCLRINIGIFDMPWINSIYKICAVVSIFMAFIHFLKDREKTKELLILLSFLLVLTGTTFLNRLTFSRMSITMLVDTFVYILVFWYLAPRVCSKKTQRTLFGIYFWTITAYCVIAVLVYFTGLKFTLPNGYVIAQEYSPIFKNRMLNVLVQPNQGAINALIATILLSTQHNTRTTCAVGFRYILYTLFLLVILFSDSRGTWTVALFALIFFAILRKNVLSRKTIVRTCLLIICFFGIAMLIRPLLDIGRSMSSALATVESTPDTSRSRNVLFTFFNALTTGRLELWFKTVVLTKGWHILIGNGISGFQQMGNAFENAHSLLFDTYFRTGLTGTVLLTCFFALVLPKSYKYCKQTGVKVGLLLVCFSLLTFSMIDCGVLFLMKAYNAVFWLTSGILFKNTKAIASGVEND